MKRLLVLSAMLLALAVVVLGQGARAEDKDTKDEATIKKIMQKSFGKGGLCGKCIEAAKEKDWDKANMIAKEWLKAAKKLPDLKPPVGDVEGWKKKAETFVKTLTTLEAATEKKEAKRANGALGAIRGSCKSCHDNYKGGKKK